MGIIRGKSKFNSWKEARPDIRRIGRELGVEYVLEGSVRRAGNRLRIAAQLIRVNLSARHFTHRNLNRKGAKMKLKLFIGLVVVCATSVPGWGQTHPSGGGKSEIAKAANQAQDLQPGVMRNWDVAMQLSLGVADAMPADKYDFRAAKGVRTFGEQVTHTAGVIAQLLSWVTDKPAPPNGVNTFDQLKTKEEMMAAFRKTVGEGTEALKKMTDKQLAEKVETQFFGKTTRYDVLMNLIGHTNRQYGQMVVYLRLNGIVPPNSRN